MRVEKPVLPLWILSFLTFSAILADFSIVSYWIREGPDFILRPYLIGDVINRYIGGGSVFSYLCISLTATFIFLGLTCFSIYETPSDMTMIKMLGEVQVSQGKTQETILRKIEGLDEKFSTIEEKIKRDSGKVNMELLKKIRTEVEDAQREALDLLTKGNEKVQRNIASAVEINLNEIKKEMLSEFEKQREKMLKLDNLGKQNALFIKEGKIELAKIHAKLEKLEERVLPPHAIFTSQDSIEEIKGIGQHLFEKFKNLGITTIGELISTDPVVIHEKIPVSQKMVERFQAIAQLLMIPKVDEKDAEMLFEAGIISRQDLAEQNLSQLSRKIGEIAKIYLEEKKISKEESPTIEEISSWIRMAKYM